MVYYAGHKIYNILRNKKEFMPEFNYEMLEDLITIIVDIICKKIPSEININPNKLDMIVNKIKLVPIPRDIVEFNMEYKQTNILEDMTEVEETRVVEKNTGERALVRIRIPQKKIVEDVETNEQNE